MGVKMGAKIPFFVIQFTIFVEVLFHTIKEALQR